MDIYKGLGEKEFFNIIKKRNSKLSMRTRGLIAEIALDQWEEVPEEDLWEDGEADTVAVAIKIYSKVCRLGEWKLIREDKNKDNER